MNKQEVMKVVKKIYSENLAVSTSEERAYAREYIKKSNEAFYDESLTVDVVWEECRRSISAAPEAGEGWEPMAEPAGPALVCAFFELGLAIARIGERGLIIDKETFEQTFAQAAA